MRPALATQGSWLGGRDHRQCATARARLPRAALPCTSDGLRQREVNRLSPHHCGPNVTRRRRIARNSSDCARKPIGLGATPTLRTGWADNEQFHPPCRLYTRTTLKIAPCSRSIRHPSALRQAQLSPNKITLPPDPRLPGGAAHMKKGQQLKHNKPVIGIHEPCPKPPRQADPVRRKAHRHFPVPNSGSQTRLGNRVRRKRALPQRNILRI